MNSKRPRVDAWPARSNMAHNPFQALLSDATEEHGWDVLEFRPLRSIFRRADVWHWHWPDGQFAHKSRTSAWIRFCALVILLLSAKIRQIPIVWTAHNIGGHIVENRPVEDVFWRIFHKQLSAVHYLSQSSRAAAEDRFPALRSKPFVITRHGHYREIYGEPLCRREARATYGLDGEKLTLVFCGKVSAYKGVEDLIRAFQLTSEPNLQLLIAGSASEEEAGKVEYAAAQDSRMRLHLQLLNDAEMKAAVSAADLVVLPYREVTNSGSALLALSLNRPVLAANRGSIAELAADIGSDWVTTYDGPLTDFLLLSSVVTSRERETSTVALDSYDWDRIAIEVTKLYAQLKSLN